MGSHLLSCGFRRELEQLRGRSCAGALVRTLCALPCCQPIAELPLLFERSLPGLVGVQDDKFRDLPVLPVIEPHCRHGLPVSYPAS